MPFGKKRSRRPGSITLIVELVLGVLLGALFAAVWLAAKPVDVLDANPLPPKPGAIVERHKVHFVQGRQTGVRSAEWAAKERAFITRTPGSLQVAEQDVNRWIAVNFGDADRTIKWDPVKLEILPDPPLFRFDGESAEIGMVMKVKVFETEKRLIVQTRGTFAERGDRQVFVPQKVWVGSCPIPVVLGGAKLVETIADSFVPSESVAAAWAAVDEVKIEESRMRLAIR